MTFHVCKTKMFNMYYSLCSCVCRSYFKSLNFLDLCFHSHWVFFFIFPSLSKNQIQAYLGTPHSVIFIDTIDLDFLGKIELCIFLSCVTSECICIWRKICDLLTLWNPNIWNKAPLHQKACTFKWWKGWFLLQYEYCHSCGFRIKVNCSIHSGMDIKNNFK